jgi:hypothetical protein
MQRVEPAEANEVSRRRRGHIAGFIRDPEHEAERWRQRPELRRRHEGEVDLQRAGKQEHPVHPRPGEDVEMMQGEVLTVHVRRPIREYFGYCGGVANSEREIDIRPLILVSGCGRTGDRSAGNTVVIAGVREEVRAQEVTTLGSKHASLFFLEE